MKFEKVRIYFKWIFGLLSSKNVAIDAPFFGEPQVHARHWVPMSGLNMCVSQKRVWHPFSTRHWHPVARMHLWFPKKGCINKNWVWHPLDTRHWHPVEGALPLSKKNVWKKRWSQKNWVWHPFVSRHWHPVARMPLCVPEKGVHPKCREENSMSFHVTLLQMLKLVGMRHCWQMVQTWTWWKCQLLTNLWNVENKFKGFSSSQKPTNHLPNQVQISSQHQVPKTWVKQHPKTPQPTKTNENPSPSYSMHL